MPTPREHDQDCGPAFAEFVRIIKALRTPETGCPWDLEQDHRTLRPYLIEEPYEVLDAIDRGSDDNLCEELGDLLLQVVLHAQVAADRGAFAIADVLHGIADKMIRRHPHVFGNVQAADAAEVSRNWERIKAAEKPASGSSADRLPKDLPALLRGQRVLSKLKDIAPADVAASLRGFHDASERSERERHLGDLLLAVCRLARGSGLDAETCLRSSIDRYANDEGRAR